MKILIIYKSAIDPYGTHRAFSDSILKSVRVKGHNGLIVDLTTAPEIAYRHLTSGEYDLVHLEQTHGATLVEKAKNSGARIPLVVSLVRDMPFYPWIEDNLVRLQGNCCFFYVEPTAVSMAQELNPNIQHRYHPSLYTSALLANERYIKPSKRPLSNLYVGSYAELREEKRKVKSHRSLSLALDMLLDNSSITVGRALELVLDREVSFVQDKDLVPVFFLLNQVARSVRRERFIRKVGSSIPMLLAWKGSLPEGIKLHRDTKVIMPPSYAQTVKLMHYSKNMLMVINNFGSSLSERQLSSLASGCVPMTTTNGAFEKYPQLREVCVGIDNLKIEKILQASRDNQLLDCLHEKMIGEEFIQGFSPDHYLEAVLRKVDM